MKRIHLFEFEDFKWFPSFLRDYLTDFLQFIANRFDVYKPVVPVIQRGLAACSMNVIVDLGSGGGGGYVQLSKHLLKDNPSLKIMLTDYYPNVEAFKRTKNNSHSFGYIATPIDARDVPKSMRGLRTQFLSFHHFKRKDAMKILQNVVDCGESIVIIEAQERGFGSLLAMFFSPITVLIMTPFIRPFKIGRIIFTYLIPLVPFFVWWDGIVSALRTYSVSELNKMISEVKETENFDWEVGRIDTRPGVLIYLLGYLR